MKKTNRNENPARKKQAAKSAVPKKVTTGYFLAPFLITVIALAVESCLVFNQKTGIVGSWIYNVFVGTFGIAGYFIPVGALVIAFFFNSITENRTMTYKCVMLAIFSAVLAALNSLLSFDNLAGAPVNVPDYFVKGYNGEGGGAVGGLVGKLLSVSFGNVFSVIISIVLCILTLSLFIGTTKTGLWYYLREMRMFGAEKTAVLKEPKKAPEKISSKETETPSVEPKNIGCQVEMGANTVNSGVGATFSSGNVQSDPFRYGSEVSKRSANKQFSSIDLRRTEEKSEDIKDIYSEETEEVKKAPEIKMAQSTVQPPVQNGRAYSPFADPFIKREEFIKNGGVAEPRAPEAPSAPSRAYSPFADPFTKRDEFIRQGNAAADDAERAAEIKVAQNTRPAGIYYGNASESPIGSQVTPPPLQIKTPPQYNVQHDVLPGQSVNATQGIGYGQNTLQGTAQFNAIGNGAPLNTQDPYSQQTNPATESSPYSVSLQTDPMNVEGAKESRISASTDGFDKTPISFESAKKTGEAEDTASEMAVNTVVPPMKNAGSAAPWDVAVKTAAPIASSGTSYLDDDEYTEDVYDEEEETGGFVNKENIPVFSTGSFTNAYADRYNAEKNNAEQSAKDEAEKVAYRDHSEKFYPNYVYPSSVLLEQRSAETTVTEDDVIEVKNKLLGKLASFKIEAALVGYSAGPSITRYELAPGPGVTVKAITNRIEDIALELQSDGVRIATVPGKSVIGIEVPNKKVSVVSLRSLIENRDFMDAKSKITVCVGLTVTGKPIYMDIDDMPHVLIAGQTKSGKSVAINCMLLSLLYRTTPDEVQLILIDPKRVELNIYAKVPHLAMPVIDDPQRAAAALRWAVCEMERRYEMMDNLGVRNRDEYYELKAEDPSLEYLPQIVIIIDELADLMLQVREHVETLINRLAAKARACGIHLVVGTQRPSVDIVTGLIKANIPARISFQVSSSADSRIILGAVGAEKLLGRGDMLYQATGAGRVRVQGAFVSSSEIKRVTKFIIDNNGEAVFDPEVMRQLDVETDKINKTNKKAPAEDADSGSYVDSSEADFEYICKAMEYVFESGVTTTNNIQRRLRIGFNRAADIVDTLENLGFISRRNGSKPRDILIDPEQFEQWKVRNAP